MEDRETFVARFIKAGGEPEQAHHVYTKMYGQEAGENILPDLFGEKPHTTRALVPRAQKKENTQITQIDSEASQLTLDITTTSPTSNPLIGFWSSAMIYASLPITFTKNNVFTREYSGAEITIMNTPKIGLPYGKLARLILAFICSEAKRTGCQQLKIGNSLRDFARKLGLGESSAGGIDRARIESQARRLFTSNVTVIGTRGNAFQWKNVSITNEGSLFWSFLPEEDDAIDKGENKAPWDSTIMLSEVFYDDCINHSVPIDLRVIQKLMSPLSIDLYVWLTYRYNALTNSTSIPWQTLKLQFGSNYPNTDQGLYNFRKKFKMALRDVSNIYSEARFSVADNYLTLLPSKPHILPPAPDD